MFSKDFAQASPPLTHSVVLLRPCPAVASNAQLFPCSPTTMGLHRNNSLCSLCSHDFDHKCEVCLATSNPLSVDVERYSIQVHSTPFRRI